ncbi:MAG TPA: hypothetical protein VLV28_02505 [Gaiellaceae bacterium]|nr:hypothetical protein [Gaiellaceae bacterium]
MRLKLELPGGSKAREDRVGRPPLGRDHGRREKMEVHPCRACGAAQERERVGDRHVVALRKNPRGLLDENPRVERMMQLVDRLLEVENPLPEPGEPLARAQFRLCSVRHVTP